MALGTRGAPGCFPHWASLRALLFWALMLSRVCSQDLTGGGTGFSLHPPYFNLAEGAKIHSTATCGQEESHPGPWALEPRSRMDLYCKLVGGPAAAPTPGHTIQGQSCDFCSSDDPNKAHPISNAIDGTERWWQSPPLSLGLHYNEVNVTVDLGQLFHVAYVLIKFANSPRPDLWVLEHSVDFGSTYMPWQYFAHSKLDCINHFGKEAKQPITRDDDVICTTEYSRIVPLENGEVVVSLVNGRPGAKHFMDSPILREFTKATNIRLRFLRTNTLLGHLISKAQNDPTVTRRYYYSIKDISIGGRCVCHGHADDATCATNPCQCQHNTCGEICDRCCPGYHQKPWRPASVDTANECEPCNCHGHASDCYYDADVDYRRASLDLYGRYNGGGVCINCQHNTAGHNCEMCAVGFYRPYGIPKEAPDGCIPCSCNPDQSDGCEEGSGICHCKPNFKGYNCEQCADGYYGFPSCFRIPHYPLPSPSPTSDEPAAGHIKECDCSPDGVMPEVCDSTGKCLCSVRTEGVYCDRCKPGYHSFPSCQACQCSLQGSYQSRCDPVTGQCDCRPGVVGQRCERCSSESDDYPLCEGFSGDCDPAGTRDSTNGVCRCLSHVEGVTCNRCKPLYWNLARENPYGCTGCNCEVTGTISGIGECHPTEGYCHCKTHVCSSSCDTCKDGYFHLEDQNYFGCTGCQCDVGGAVSHICSESSGKCVCKNNIEGTNCNHPKENYYFPDLHQMKFEIEEGTTKTGRGVRFGYDPAEFPGFSWRGYAQMSPIQKEVRIPVMVEKSNLSLFLIILRYINPALHSVTGRIIDYMSDGISFSCLGDITFPPSKEPAFLTIPGKGFTEPFSLSPGNWIITIAAEGVLLDYLVLLPSDYYEASILQLRVTKPCTYRGAAGDNCLVYQHLPMDSFSCVLGLEEQYFKQNGVYRPIITRQPTLGHPAMAYITGRQVEVQLRLKIPGAGSYVVVVEYANEDPQLYVANVKINNNPSHIPDTRLCIIPVDKFSVEYAEPKLQCIASYGRSPNQSIIKFKLLHQRLYLLCSQNPITLARRIPHLGRYVFIAHYHQAHSPLFPVSVYINGGIPWSGSFNASYCPNVLGCRELVIADNRIALDITNPEISVTIEVPQENYLVLEYILLVPGDSYTNDILLEKPLDKSSDFINMCGENSFYIDPGTSPEFCQNSAISLVASYNNEALPCNCSRQGATSSTCNPAGGQCSCSQNVIGRTCSRCATGYYGFPFCRPCNCGRRLCDEVTGNCICPPQTIKPTCEVCEQQSFSFHPIVGCEECNCSINGVAEPLPTKCDGITGQCICKPRISGRQCDRCAPGYFHFPNCIPCDCNPEGTEPQICNPQTGACLCKENVEGYKCDFCRSGTFYYDASNPMGCTKCFCFGATDVCHSSSKHRKKFVDMRYWNLETPDENQIAVIFNPGSNSVVADIQELPPTVHSLYWTAPSPYLWEKISSYGGYLTYQVKSFGLPNEGMVLLDKRPDVILMGRQMTVVYMDTSNPLPDRQYYGRVQLVEGNFRHASSNSMVSREELLMILSRLESLRIRALYFSETQRLTLAEVGLEDSTTSGSGKVAYNVEICSCPPEYSGDSCQECSPGHYRDNQGLFLGRCVPCRCNGHSSRCHDGSGICINCQHNTAGENCELCKEGYMGNATHGTCRLCPCPLSVPSNSFATGCVGSGRNMQCFCKPGYTGLSCENCAPGYFGNPLKFGSSCQPKPLYNIIHNFRTSCDSCANILLLDLSTMKDEINLIKARLQNIGANSQALDQLKALEARIRETQVNDNQELIVSQKSKVEKLETDTNGLKKDIAALLEKAAFNSKKYEKLAMDAEDTFKNASHLLLTIDLLLKNINILVKDVASSQGSSPSGDNAKNLAEAQRMLNEMRKRNFNPQKREAEIERNEAKALLDRVRNQFQKHQGQHKDLIKSITKSINDYEAKLNDLREALDEATAQTKQANNINKDNEALIRDLTKQQKDATAHLNAAETSLGQTSSMLRLLQKSKEDYEKLAAQLDGAKQELNEKVSLLSKAASKEPLVIMAEKHAQSLQDLTKQLEEMKKNTSSDELVKCAVDASNAYENIINAVKEADEASKKAKGAADSALKKVQTEDLPGKAKKSKDDSQALLDQAKKTQKSFDGIKPELEDLKDRLVEAKDKKKLLSGDLAALQTNDIENMINNAKAVVKNAEGITKNVLEELSPIDIDVKNLKGTHGSTQSADFNKAIAEASKSVKNLTDSLPDLLDAMNRINNLMPLGNISENVSRIRELIQQARDAANKVAIPMRFNGTSGVEVQPPSNLEDLKAYTSLSFYLQRPLSRSDRRKRQLSPNMFVMYLGSKDTTKDYMGFAIEDDRLLYVYNLGGNEAKLQVNKFVTASNPNEAIMDRVVLERIYQHATLQYIKSYTSSKPNAPENYKTEADRHTLFNLDPKDVVFYVGGYPADFRVRIFPGEGCIEFDYLNQIGVSLYNFRKTFNLNTTEVEPCRRHKKDSGENYFEGFGYASLTYKLTLGKSLLYEQAIQTTVDSGLLLFAEDNDNYISLNIEGGILVLKYKINSDTVKEAKSNGGPINNGNDYLVRIRITHTGGLISLNDVDFFSFSTYYLGGIPLEIREKFNIKTPAFRGCVKNVKTPVGTAKFQESYGVSRKCFDGWKVSVNIPCIYSTLIFGTQESHIISYMHKMNMNSFCLRLSLLVDDEPVTENVGSVINIGRSINDLYLGGKNFEGCISDVFIQRSHFSLDIRTMEPAGMILMMREQYESTHLTLHLSKGRFVLSLGNKGQKVKIRSQDKYNDGKWHTVVFNWDGFNGRLVIDGLKSRKGSLTRRISLESMSSVHLGGVPSLKLQKSFIGCVRNVQVDGTQLEKPSQVLGVLPCYDGNFESGVFIAEDGGHITVEKNFVLGPEFEMALNVRPQSQTGVIVHSGTEQGGRLSLYMDAGKVR
uniref:Laminin subunit alpha 3 n=1 Tax=Leptobrachium leishanense TaxID=445787 RepID=A0A8C5MWE3_9ANUR